MPEVIRNSCVVKETRVIKDDVEYLYIVPLSIYGVEAQFGLVMNRIEQGWQLESYSFVAVLRKPP